MTRLILLTTSAAALLACSPPADPVAPSSIAEQTCLSGGPILTGTNEEAGAIIMSGRTIVAVLPEGSSCPDQTVRIDLAGATLMPGLTDAHAHLLGIGLREMTLNLEGTTSISDLQDKVRDAVSDLSEGETLYGRGWIETHWPEGRFPTAADLDAIATDRAIIIERADGHAMAVNSFALKKAGITGDTDSPEGGAINLDKDGTPTGMLIDNAMALVAEQLPGLDAATKREAYRRGAELYAARGWTNIHNMSVPPEDVALLEEMDAAGELPIRVYNSLDTRDLSDVIDANPNDKVTTRAIKLYSDGALGSRGAALLADYSDDPGNMGLMTMTEADIAPLLTEAKAKNIQVNTHAIGDRANRSVLDWYADALDSDDRRWRIEHAQILSLPDLGRFAELGVIASMQPSHAIGDLHFAPDRLGQDRLDGAYAWQSLIDTGTVIAAGSDAPVEVGDPRIEFHAATQRTDLEGFSNADWKREQRVNASDALAMFTLSPAYAAFQENELGTIEVGKFADFSVFSTPLTDGDAMAAVPVMTIVDGEVVFKRADN